MWTTVPPSALPTFKKDLGDRAITGPTAQNQTLDTPLRLDHFGGEEGRLRRLALSAAINRQQICDQIFAGARSPSRDFTAASLPGFDPNLPGNDALDYDPDRAKDLWAQADAISPWTGQYAIGYNADGGHQEWVDAVANSIKNTLGIDAVGAPQPTFAQLRTQTLQLIFGVLVFCIACYMAFGKASWRLSDHLPGGIFRAWFGPLMGFASVLLGIGGGSIGTPMLTRGWVCGAASGMAGNGE